LVLLNLLTRPALVAAFDVVSLAVSCFTAVPEFPVGHAAAGDWLPGDIPDAALARNRLAVPLVAVRLRFQSGLSKLVGGDPPWSGLAALNHYFEVQPLPNPLACYAHQLPDWLLKIGTGGTLFVELIVPVHDVPLRQLALRGVADHPLAILIILTSNHNWINLLTILLCLFLFDDGGGAAGIAATVATCWNGLPTLHPALHTLRNVSPSV
jgi:hypothetical protein